MCVGWIKYQEFCDFLKPGILDTLYMSKGKCWCLLTELTINNPLPARLNLPIMTMLKIGEHGKQWQKDGQSGAIKLIKKLVRKVRRNYFFGELENDSFNSFQKLQVSDLLDQP